MDAEQLGHQYNTRAWAPGFADTLARHRALGEAVRRGARARLDLRWGPSPRQALDFFVPEGPMRAVAFFIHGGYWQYAASTKESVSFLAPAFLERGIGFCAPGYTLSAPLVDLLRARGYAYDSSLLPSPAYYAAKAAAIGALALAGRHSRSILGDVTQLARPRTPHRHKGLLELPIATLPTVRVPFIGTLLTQTPPELSLKLAQGLADDELVVIELHGIDLCDASDGVPAALADHQRDLATPASVKTARLEAVLRALLTGREGVTLAEAARLLDPVASE